MSPEMVMTCMWAVITGLCGIMVYSLKGQIGEFKTQITFLANSLGQLSGDHRVQIEKHGFNAQIVQDMKEQIDTLQKNQHNLRDELLFLRSREHDLINALAALWGVAYHNHGFKELSGSAPRIRQRRDQD